MSFFVPNGVHIPGTALYQNVDTTTLKIYQGLVTTSITDGVATLSGGYLTGLNDPIVPSGATTKSYVDNLFNNILWKSPCRLTTTADLVSLSGLPIIDGVQVNDGDRILVKDQNDAVDNGYYEASIGMWMRTYDMPYGIDVAGYTCIILQGTTYEDISLTCTSDPPNDVVGTDDLFFNTFTPFLVAGEGLSQVGATINVNTDGTIISINGSNEITLEDTEVIPDVYGTSTIIPSIVIDQQGRITTATEIDIPDASAVAKGLVNTISQTFSGTKTFGTIIGTWNGSVIAGQYGGTGVANTGRTITIGGNFSTADAISFATTSTANRVLYTSAANTVSTLATANSAVLVTGSTGTPVLSSTMTNGQIIIGSTGATPVAANITGSATITVTNGAGTISLNTTGVVTGVTGTTDRITVTGTTTPVIDISAAYVGQTSLVTLGTITTGTWNGGVIPGLYGGTGVANSGRTLTLGGNFSTAGALAFATTATVNRLLYTSTANNVSTLATANSAVVVTTSAGVPILSSTMTNGQIIIGATSSTPVAANITGTSVTVTNGLGTIALNISASYAGQTSLTTLGTITAGTWNSTLIAGQYGGTGVANTGRTITVGGNFSTTDAISFGATATANRVLYTSAANTVSALATANSAVLVTTSAGVPVLSSTMTDGQIIIGSTSGTPTAASLTVSGYGLTLTSGPGALDIRGGSVSGTKTWFPAVTIAGYNATFTYILTGSFLTLYGRVNLTTYNAAFPGSVNYGAVSFQAITTPGGSDYYFSTVPFITCMFGNNTSTNSFGVGVDTGAPPATTGFGWRSFGAVAGASTFLYFSAEGIVNNAYFP